MGMFGKNGLGLIARGNDALADYHFQVSPDGKTLISWHCDPKPQPKPAPPTDYAKPRGFGDTLNKWIVAAGAKLKCVGCKNRQYWLNRVIPYKG